MTTVKEDCVLKDETGSATIHMWDPLFKNIKTSNMFFMGRFFANA